MAIIAKIAARPGKPARSIPLRKAVTILAADPDAEVAIVDEATGLAIDGASIARGPNGVSVTLPALALAAADEQASGEAAGSSVEPTQGAGASGGGGNGGGLALGVLGGLGALGGLALAAGGGAKGNGNGGNPPPAADTTPPAAPTGLALASADDSGSSSTDRVTNQTTGLTITGTAEAGSTVILRNGSTTLATVTAGSTGAFSADVTLAPGATSITATATDAAGNVSAASAPLTITVDTAAPAAPMALALAAADDTGISSSDRITSQTSGLTISGTAEAGSSVVLRNGSTTLATVTVDASGAFSADVTLAPGAASITATATDAAGNVSAASAPLAITVDTAAPAAPTALALAAADDNGTSSTDRITSQTSGLTISGTAEAGSSVVLRNGSTTLATATADASGAFSADVTLAPGAASITATATDAAGNVSAASAPLTITVDTAAPAAPMALALAAAADTGISSSDRITSQTSGLTISGTAEAGSSVVLRNGSTTLATATADASGAFSADVTLAPGAASITATATDAAGNVSPASAPLAITVDTAAPTVVITSTSSSVLKNTPVTLTFTFSEVPQEFTAADIISTGTITGLAVSATDPRVYTAQLVHDAASNGTISVSVTPGSWTDTAGNSSAVAPALTLPYDAGTAGAAIDGYIARGLVFRDADNDGVWDHEAFTDANNNGVYDQGEQFVDADGNGLFNAEFSSVTDAQGNFSGLFGTGRIVLTSLIAGNGTNLSYDVSTGAAFAGQYVAPDGSTVVTPLTTLVAAVAGAGATPQQIAAAEAQVRASLGIAAAVNLNTFDPFAVASDPTDAAALEAAISVQKAAVQVANIISVLSGASEAAAAGSAQGAAAATVNALVGIITGGTSLDLTSSTVLTQVVAAVADAAGGPAEAAIANQSAAIGTALANVNTAVSEAGGSDALTTFAAIITTQVVAQQTLAQDVADAINAGETLDPAEYQGAALSTKIDSAAGSVQTVLPAEPASTVRGAPDRPVIDDGARISAAEASDGIVVSVGLSAGAGAVAGDTLRLMLGTTVVASVTLTGNDLPAAGGTATLLIPLAANLLGADGTKVFTAELVTAGGAVGPASLPAITTLDTSTIIPGSLSLAAEDDTGVSASDLVTSRTSALTISGTAEANAVVSLFDGTTLLGTATADQAGRFLLDVTVASGVRTLIATAVDPAGNVSTASAALVVTVDTVAPTAPAGLVAAEGTIVTVLEAADGTSVSGSVEAGSNVLVTFTNGSRSLVKEATVAGTTFTAALSAQELDTLGTGQISYRAVASDVAGNASAPSATASFVFSRDAFVTDQRLDDALSIPGDDLEENGIGVTALSNGGFAVHWVVDIDGDREGDSIAVQRFAADGSKIGGVVVLQNVSPGLLNHPGDDPGIDFRALDDGGYALAYSLSLPYEFAPFTFVPGQTTLGFLGRVESIFIGSMPAGATFSLVGAGANGQPVTVPVTPVDGQIVITPEIRAQFATSPSSLRVTGLTSGSVSGYAELRETVAVDRAAGLFEFQSTLTVAANGTVNISGPAGRIEQFDVNQIAGTPTSGTLRIMTVNGFSVNLAGIPNASVTATGVIQITGVLPDTDGIVRVPQAILDQLGDTTAFATLTLAGLSAGSTVQTAIAYRPVAPITEGVFVQTFDANGVGGPVSARLDTGSAVADLTEDTVSISRLSGGGFAVKWPVDSNGDGDTDTLAIQRFTADGSKVGAAILLQGVDPRLVSHEGDDPAIDLQPLESGGYALAYTLPLESLGKSFTLTPSDFQVTFAGKPTEFFVSSAPPGVSFLLVGASNAGTPLTVTLSPVNGSIQITQAILDQFLTDNRLTLRATGLTSGSINGFAELKQDVAYDQTAALQGVPFSGTVAASGSFGIGVASGRAELFDLNVVSGTPTSAVLRIWSGIEQPLDLTGLPGAFAAGSGLTIIPVTPDAEGIVRVPASILSQLGESDAAISLVLNGLPANTAISGTTSLRPATALPEGVFVQTFDANGVGSAPSARIDTPASPAELDDEDRGVRITALPGGGFAVHWLVDFDGDGDGDTLGIQRFAADGSKEGDVVVLQNLDPRLTSNESDDLGFDLQALANGGYVLAYNLPLEETFRSFNVSAPANGLSFLFALVGKPQEIYVGSAPPNAVFALAGVNNSGTATVVNLAAENGVIVITQAILDQFPFDNRLSLRVTGLTQGQQFPFGASILKDVTYDLAAPLNPVAVTGVGAPNGIGVVSTPLGRLEGFTIGSATYANGTGPTSVNAQLAISGDPANIDLTGIAGASRLASGAIAVNGLVRGADGAYRIPASLLSQLGESDVNALFFVNGLVAGSQITAEALVRAPIVLPEGVFVQTFDATGQPVSADLTLTGSAGEDVLVGDRGDDVLIGLAGNDTLIAGLGKDTLTGGEGADLFVLESPSGQVLSAADLITDFTLGEDRIALGGGLSFGDVLVVQGNPATNGAAESESLIIHFSSGDILARLTNVDALQVTQASFL